MEARLSFVQLFANYPSLQRNLTVKDKLGKTVILNEPT